MIFNVDLHVHSGYTVGVSKRMNFPTIIEFCKIKGINCLGICDLLYEKWEKEVRNHIEEGYTFYKDIAIVLCQEIQDCNRVHHLLIFPSFREVRELREKLRGKGNLNTGRAIVKIDGKELFKICKELSISIGPCHAFTPYYGIYSKFDSLNDCYNGKVPFLELGLSADSFLANTIGELQQVTFLSNSDCHRPERIGREFQRIKITNFSFESFIKAIKEEKIIFNAGLNPKEGKYHLTACNRCYRRYSLEGAKMVNFRCSCGGKIKIGVKDRIKIISEKSKEKREKERERPGYKYIIPLDEIIEKLNLNKKIYNLLISKIGSEIEILLDVEIEEIAKVNEKVANAIKMLRENKIVYDPGGGGRYGEFFIPSSDEEFEKLKGEIERKLKEEMEVKQKSLFQFLKR